MPVGHARKAKRCLLAALRDRSPVTDVKSWLEDHRITEVECLVADQSGIARGKILPAAKFIRSLEDDSLRIPEELFVQTVSGSYPEEQENRVTDPAMRDVRMRPDPATLRLVPWYEEPTAQVIGDCYHHDGKVLEIAPRQVLRRVLEAYAERGWQPVVAPELEFFLTKVNRGAPRPDRRATGSRRSTSSIRCSTTPMTGAKRKAWTWIRSPTRAVPPRWR